MKQPSEITNFWFLRSFFYIKNQLNLYENYFHLIIWNWENNLKLFETIIFELIHFLKICSIFSGSLDNFGDVKCSYILRMSQKYDEISQFFWSYLKVRLNRKADWRAIDSPKKQTDEFDLFAVKSKNANKTNPTARSFFGRS